MAKAAYTGVNNIARKVKNIYVGVNNTARKVAKGYVGVNGVARQFWPPSSVVIYNKVIKPSTDFLPNVAYNLNKLDMYSTLESSLRHMRYLLYKDEQVRGVIDKYLLNLETIWQYIEPNLTVEDTLIINAYFRFYTNNADEIYITLNFMDTDVSNAQFRGAYRNTPFVNYMLSQMYSAKTKSYNVDVLYNTSTDEFSYRLASTTYLMRVGLNVTYAISETAGHTYATYTANNIGATLDNQEYNPEKDYIGNFNCATDDIVVSYLDSGNTSLMIDRTNNCSVLQFYTNYYTRDGDGLRVTVGATILSPWTANGMQDVLVKFGTMELSTTHAGKVYALFYWDNGGIAYQEDTESWYFFESGNGYTLISSNKDLFQNAGVQIHFVESNKTVEIYVNGSKISTMSNPKAYASSGEVDGGVGLCGPNRTGTVFQYIPATIERVKISRSQAIESVI